MIHASSNTSSKGRKVRGFTLVELLLAITIFSVIMVALFEILGQTQRAWGNTRAQLGQFQEAHKAFQMMTRRISEATLNPYWDYEYPNGDKTRTPSNYVRQSELHFVSGDADSLTASGSGTSLSNGLRPTHSIFFQGPFGFHDPNQWENFNILLNSWGFYIELNEDLTDRPAHVGTTAVRPRQRFRLMELRAPAEETSIYDASGGDGTRFHWFRKNITTVNSAPAGGVELARPIADNVVALIISPQAPEGALSDPSDIAPQYQYDTRAFESGATGTSVERSRHQLPPLVRLTMIAIDEPSAIRVNAMIDAGNMPSSINDLLTGTTGLFSQATNYDDDLQLVEQALLDAGIDYRVFSSTVRLRNARWSPTH